MTDPPAGIIGVDTSEELTKFLNQVVPNAQAIANRSPQGMAEYFPAKILARAWDATLGVYAYSWLEQAFDGTGNRIDHPSANMGSPAAMPAYAYGDGTVLGTFPHETMLRRVGTNLRTAVAFEFPLFCACVSGGSGSGSGSGGGGFVVVPCCPNPIPTVLHVTMTSTLACINGQTFTLTCYPPTLVWSPSGDVHGSGNIFFPCLPFTPYGFNFRCGAIVNGVWNLFIGWQLGSCPFGGASSDSGIALFATSVTCHPFSVTFATTYGGTFCPGIPSTPVTITVTE